MPAQRAWTAAAFAEALRDGGAQPSAARGTRGSFEVSVASASRPSEHADNELAHALAAAETACKAAKDRGRNRVEVYQDSRSEHRAPLCRHPASLGKLRDAIDARRLRLDAQPILPLARPTTPGRTSSCCCA